MDTARDAVICKCKGCGKVRRDNVAFTKGVWFNAARADQAVPDITKSPAAYTTLVGDSGAIYLHNIGGWWFAGKCECGRWIAPKFLRVSNKVAHQCNAKCLAATGPACECACRGKNHGGKHAA